MRDESINMYATTDQLQNSHIESALVELNSSKNVTPPLLMALGASDSGESASSSQPPKLKSQNIPMKGIDQSSCQKFDTGYPDTVYDNMISSYPTDEQEEKANVPTEIPILERLKVVQIVREPKAKPMDMPLPTKVVIHSQKYQDDNVPGSSISELGIDGIPLTSPRNERKMPSRFTFDFVLSKSCSNNDEEKQDILSGNDSASILDDLEKFAASANGSTDTGDSSKSDNKLESWRENVEVSIEMSMSQHRQICKELEENSGFVPMTLAKSPKKETVVDDSSNDTTSDRPSTSTSWLDFGLFSLWQ